MIGYEGVARLIFFLIVAFFAAMVIVALVYDFTK